MSKTGGYVDDDLRPIPPLEREGLTTTPAQYQPHSRHSSLGASQDQINLRNDDEARRIAFEEPAPHSLSTTFGVDSGGRRNGNVFELGKDSLLTFQPSTPQIDPEHDQGGHSHVGFKGLGHVTPLRSRGQEEDGPQERQQQEAALEPIENHDSLPQPHPPYMVVLVLTKCSYHPTKMIAHHSRIPNL